MAVEITLNAPAKNALGTATMTFLLGELARAKGQPVLLTGSGGAFSAGLNLKEVALLQGEKMLDFLRLLERCMCALYLHPAPTVALVNGHAIAGGCVLTLACDQRVVLDDPSLKIGLNEVALGVRFPPRVLAICRARIPPSHLEEVILGARLVDPETALRLGLVDVVSKDAEVVARARLEALAQLPSEAYAFTKRDLRGACDADLCPDDVEEARLAAALPAWTSPRLRETIAGLLRK